MKKKTKPARSKKSTVSNESRQPAKGLVAGIMSYGFIDTHAHLTFPEFDKDRKKVLSRAREAGVEHIITVGAGEGLAGNEKAIALAQKEDNLFATVGVHPHDASQFIDKWVSKIEEWSNHQKVVAIGEIGLDFYRGHSPKEAQIECFRKLLKLAHKVNLPVVIHSREAHDETWDIIREVGVPPQGGVFHCFSGNVRFAEEVVRAGFSISVPGRKFNEKRHSS